MKTDSIPHIYKCIYLLFAAAAAAAVTLFAASCKLCKSRCWRGYLYYSTFIYAVYSLL